MSSADEWITDLENVNWRLVMSKVRVRACFCAKVLLGLIYVKLTADGFAFLFEPLGARLSTVPALGWFLSRLAPELTRKWTIAFPIAAIVYWMTVLLWDDLLRLVFYGEHDDRYAGNEFSQGSIDFTQRRDLFTYWVAIAVLFCEACVFYLTLSMNDWGQPTASFRALFGTVIYVSIIVVLTKVSIVQLKLYEDELRLHNVSGSEFDDSDIQ